MGASVDASYYAEDQDLQHMTIKGCDALPVRFKAPDSHFQQEYAFVKEHPFFILTLKPSKTEHRGSEGCRVSVGSWKKFMVTC